MKKFSVLLILLFFVLPVSVSAQDKKFNRTDIELGGGITFGANDYHDDEIARMGGSLRLEGRYHLKKIPVDIGLQIAQSAIMRRLRGTEPDSDDAYVISSPLMIVGDYNFHLDRKINPYVGLGFGEFIGDWEDSLGFMPRVGIRFFHHINLSLDYKLLKKVNRHASLCLGFYF
jgi:hypothetical protein